MDEQELSTMKQIIRTGEVSAVNPAMSTAVITYDGSDLVSAPLKVIQMQGYSNQPWLPDIGTRVLCLCLPNNSGDGYVIGGV